MYVLDTNIISDLIRGRSGAALEWLGRAEPDELYLAATTIYELRRGLERLPRGHKRGRLEEAWTSEIRPLIAERILPLDEVSAEIWARLMVDGESKGHPPPSLDSQIAAIALANRMTVVTRDRRGFGRLRCDLLVLD